MTDHKMANQRMLNALMVLIQADDQMMSFCGAVLDLCSRDKFCDELVEFARGRFYNYAIHMYMWHICTCIHAPTYYTSICKAERLSVFLFVSNFGNGVILVLSLWIKFDLIKLIAVVSSWHKHGT